MSVLFPPSPLRSIQRPVNTGMGGLNLIFQIVQQIKIDVSLIHSFDYCIFMKNVNGLIIFIYHEFIYVMCFKYKEFLNNYIIAS